MELHHNIHAQRVISPIAAGTTGTGQTGKIVDRQGYAGLEFIFDYGTIASTTGKVTPTVLEGDVTGTLTSVADSDLLGTELGAGLTSAGTRTSGVSKNVTTRLGYKGIRRYVTVKMINTATAGIPIACTALLYRAGINPTT